MFPYNIRTSAKKVINFRMQKNVKSTIFIIWLHLREIIAIFDKTDHFLLDDSRWHTLYVFKNENAKSSIMENYNNKLIKANERCK